MLLSIIIPTLNEADVLPDILGDLKKQLNVSLEIIIGDGGSSDATESIACNFGAIFVSSERGRGLQMNAAADRASGDFIFFLHADSRIDDVSLLSNSVHALISEPCEHDRIAGHFCLRFMRTTKRNLMAYRYAEEKSAFNRVSTTNGDQGLLLTRRFFRELGGFDESMPFLEDQRIAGKIRDHGKLITLPGYLKTSARRFEAEGFHRRYILMAIMMGMHTVGLNDFFVRAPGVYRVQHDTGTLFIAPFFHLIWRMMHDDWGLGRTIHILYLLGQYLRQNYWQMFFFLDVWLRPIIGVGRYPFLNFHNRVFGSFPSVKVFDAVAGMICFVWFMGVLAPFFWLIESKKSKSHNTFN